MALAIRTRSALIGTTCFTLNSTSRAGRFSRFRPSAPALVDELALFHTADYIDKVSRCRRLARVGWTMAIRRQFRESTMRPPLLSARFFAPSMKSCTATTSARLSPLPAASCGRDRAAGFCVFNDCGIAAEYLRSNYGLKRIAYVDIDAHHGDGMFYGLKMTRT